MNKINSYFKRESGLAYSQNYDFALRRLCVAKEDNWRGISPTQPEFNPEPPILAAKFANCDGYRHILAIANEDGHIALQDTTKRNDKSEEATLWGPNCHCNAVFDLEWAPGQMRFVSASGDHTAHLWEIENGSNIRKVTAFVGHSRSVKTAAFRRNDPSVFATGGRDGAIIIWDTRAKLNFDMTPRADNRIMSGHVGGPGTPLSQKKRTRTPKNATGTSSSSITGLAFQDTYTLISCGAGDGVIKVWDLRRNYTTYKKEPLPKYSLPYAGTSTLKGFTNLIIDQPGTRLYANCMDNTIYCYNLCSYSSKPWACYKGVLNGTFYIKSCLSPDNKYLLSGSSDEKAYIWNLEYPEEPLVSLCGHAVEVTCVAWGLTHDQPIVTCSDDARHKIWRIGPEEISDIDRVENYRGQAEYVRKFHRPKAATGSVVMHKYNLRDLESTPRSLKRLVEQNERTPGMSAEKQTKKRSFLEMLIGSSNQDAGDEREYKRPKTLESRGRRLFSPSNSNVAASCSSSSVSPTVRCLNIQLESISEEDLGQQSDRANNALLSPDGQCPMGSIDSQVPCVSYKVTPNNRQHNPSPSTELEVEARIEKLNIENFNEISPKCTLSSPGGTSLPTNANVAGFLSHHSFQLTPSLITTNAVYSPTSNLPNYVIDGEAPHLGIMSPKRKPKDKVDWLTKIRKQKQMSICRVTTLTEKMQETEEQIQQNTTHHEHQRNINSNVNSISSPSTAAVSAQRTQNTPKSSVTPRRRTSLHNANHQHHPSDSSCVQHPRTPTSSRRNSETSILRFFSRQQPKQDCHSKSEKRSGGEHQADRSCLDASETGLRPLSPSLSENILSCTTNTNTSVSDTINATYQINRQNQTTSLSSSSTVISEVSRSMHTTLSIDDH